MQCFMYLIFRGLAVISIGIVYTTGEENGYEHGYA